MPTVNRSGVAVAVLLLITVGFYGRLAFTKQYTAFNHWDLATFQIPRLQFQAREIHAGRFPLWNPHVWAGQPLLGQMQGGPLYPPNILFCLLPLQNGYLRLDLLNWYYILVHYQAALGAYWLARDLGRTQAASILAGCVFSFGGFITTALNLDLMNAAAWTPLVFLFLLRMLRGHKTAASAALFGLSLGAAWLSGHHEIPLLTSVAALGVGTDALLRRPRSPWRLASLLLAGLVIAGMIAAAQAMPAYEFGKQAKRWAGEDDPVGWNDRVPYSVHARYSLPPRGLLGIVLPTSIEEDSSMAFVGAVAFTLAAFGLLAAWQDRPARYMAAMAVFAVLYALGASTPFHRLLYATIPLLDKARAPVRALHLLNFAMALLAAYGLDRLGAQRISRWVGHRVLQLSLIGLSLIELSSISAQWIQPLHGKDQPNLVDTLFQNRDTVEYLKSQRDPVRAAVNGQDIPIDFGDWHGIDMLQGAGVGITENMQQHELHTAATQRLFAATHYVGKDRSGWEQVFEGASGLKVFRNPLPLARARTVHEVASVSSFGELRRLIQDPGFDPTRIATVRQPIPPLEHCDSPNVVDIVERATDAITMRANMGCRGLLILADTFFVGWQARIDGRPTPIHEVYGAMRGIVVDAGEHVVEMRYRPKSVYLGAALAFVGLLLAAALKTASP